MIWKKYLWLVFVFVAANVPAQQKANLGRTISQKDILVGAERTKLYFPELEGKNVAIVANQTSRIGNNHLVDSLLSAGFKVQKVFCPEHGFRGLADAGEVVSNKKDIRTGLPIISLYGSNKKPNKEDLKGIDVVIFDIQDVGVRFYTYISTMHYVMEACAENNVEFLILDRPNPNGFYVDGPMLEKEHKSFVGMHPVPLVHGMTIGEYAQMINGEGWLANKVKCKLSIVPVWNYNHNYLYELPVKPSPNLPNMQAVYLYPSLALFEGTDVSVGRGTDFPFQVYGSPAFPKSEFKFTPKPTFGAKYPKHQNKECLGEDLRDFEQVKSGQLNLAWLIKAYKSYKEKSTFFNNYFYNLAGTKKLKQQIVEGISQEKIKTSWTEGIEKFKKLRAQYLLYPDFE